MSGESTTTTNTRPRPNSERVARLMLRSIALALETAGAAGVVIAAFLVDPLAGLATISICAIAAAQLIDRYADNFRGPGPYDVPSQTHRAAE